MIRVNALFTPAEVAALQNRNLSGTTCVVFDVLRATTTLLTALGNGAAAIIPVQDITEALEWQRRQPDILLGGERDGRRIGAALTGGTEFDFGNSPREYPANRVAGRTIVCTTTNGTRALRGCLHAGAVLPAAFPNIDATAAAIRTLALPELLLIGAGTEDEAAYEDILGIGALLEALWPTLGAGRCSDTVHLARNAYLAAQSDLLGAVSLYSRNGRRLLQLPDLAADVPICLIRNTLPFAARLGTDGLIIKLP